MHVQIFDCVKSTCVLEFTPLNRLYDLLIYIKEITVAPFLKWIIFNPSLDK